MFSSEKVGVISEKNKLGQKELCRADKNQSLQQKFIFKIVL